MCDVSVRINWQVHLISFELTTILSVHVIFILFVLKKQFLGTRNAHTVFR